MTHLIETSKLSRDKDEIPWILSFIVNSSKNTTRIDNTATAEINIIWLIHDSYMTNITYIHWYM